LNFYDTNAKFNFYINPENRLYISLYKGGDRLFSEYSDRSEWTTGVFDENRTKVDLKWGKHVGCLAVEQPSLAPDICQYNSGSRRFSIWHS
jgi:hypothetical protein